MIYAKNVSRAFGKSSILKDVSLRIESQSIYGLVGLNGAGKTTLIRILLGLLKRDSGELDIGGFDPWLHKQAFYQHAGVVLENDGFWGNLSVRDNLQIFASAKGISWDEAESYFKDYWGDTEIYSTTRKVKFLSRGQRVQCGLCRAYLGWPGVCFLDEPAVSLDLHAYEHFKSIAREAKSRGAVQLVSSHQLETIDDLCDRVGLLKDGKVEELSRAGGKDAWVIKVKASGEWTAILEKEGAENIRFENGYLAFYISDADNRIPVIVKGLVDAGCDISEVRPAKQDFSDAIKDTYRRK